MGEKTEKTREDLIALIGDKLVMCHAFFLSQKGYPGSHSYWEQFRRLEGEWWDTFGGRYDPQVYTNLCDLIDEKVKKEGFQ